MTDAAWADLLQRAAAGEMVAVDGRQLPAMPDATLQVNTVGQSGPGAMLEAWSFASQCLHRFRAVPRFQDDDKLLLDFGTGWARIARCFLRDMRAENIIGTDVDASLINVCRATFPGPRFLRCDKMPPLPLRDASMDFIVGYSVFSHLSEAACRAWLTEFARILRPGGMVALTTRGRWFFDYAASLTGTDPYSRSLATMFPDFTEARSRYDRGEFVHSNVPGITGGGVLDGSFYGETFIPERFARLSLSGPLMLAEFFEESGSHPILFFAKR
jgi:SAM-dependent methyltransferase